MDIFSRFVIAFSMALIQKDKYVLLCFKLWANIKEGCLLKYFLYREI